MKLFITILVSVVLSASAFAENGSDNKKVNENKSIEKVEIVEVKGTVIDVKSNEFLAGATILIDGDKIYSDLDGNFTLKNIKPGNHKIKVELISYEPVEMDIDLAKNSNLNINLVQK